MQLVPVRGKFLYPYKLSGTCQKNRPMKADQRGKHMQLLKVHPSQHLPKSDHPPNQLFPVLPPSFFIPLLFPSLFPWLPHPVLHQFAGLFSPIQKQRASSLWTRGKHASQKNRKRTIPLSLSMVIEFLNIFSKSA